MYRKLLLSLVLISGMASAQDRVTIIGEISPAVKTEDAGRVLEGSTLEVARQIAPAGWSGFASKAVNTRNQSKARIEKGQKWTEALERWLEAEGLTARLDASRRVVMLDVDRHKTQGINVTAVLPPPPPVAVVTPEAATWEITASDGTISRALQRWAAEAKVQLIYEAPLDIAAVPTKYTGSYFESLERVLSDTVNGNYPLHGCQYDNTTRILHVSQACDR